MSELSQPRAWEDLDRIELRGIEVFGYHGVFPDEKRDGQSFIADIICWLDTRPAAVTDDLRLTLNYAELAELAAGIIAGPGRDLIETVAAEIADSALSRFALLQAIEVTVHKPQAPIGRAVSDVAVVARRVRGH